MHNPDKPIICELCGGQHATANHPQEHEDELKVELKEIAKSDNPVNVENGLKKKIVLMKPWNDYALVILEEGGKVNVLDEKGKNIGNAVVKKETTWKSILNDIYPGRDIQYLHKIKNDTEYAQISNLPWNIREKALRAFKKETINNSSAVGVYINNFNNIKIDLSKGNVNVFDGGKYILITDHKTKDFVCLITENEQGIVQAPKDWKVASTMGGDYNQPDAQLEKYVAEMLKKTENIKELNEAYSAVFTDVGISVCKKNDISGKPCFQELIPSVKENIAVNPANTNLLYYCSTESPAGITRLDMGGDSAEWKKTVAKLPKNYKDIRNLQFDPSGNMLLFYSEGDLVMLAADTLQEVVRKNSMTNVNFDSQGRIKAVDKDGYLVTYDFDIDHLREQIEKNRAKKIASGIEVKDVFSLEQEKKQQAAEVQVEILEPLKLKIENEAAGTLAQIQKFEHAKTFRKALEALKNKLGKEGLKQAEISFVIGDIESKVFEKEKQFAAEEAKKILSSFEKIMGMGLSISTLAEAKNELEAMKALEPFLGEDERERHIGAFKEFSLRSLEFFQSRGNEVIGEAQGLVDGISRQLEGLTSKKEFDDWQEFRYPQIKGRLNDLLRDCPMEADSAYKALLGARDNLQKLVDNYGHKFKVEYAKIREKAAERMETMAEGILNDTANLLERIKSKGFAKREDAELFLSGSESKKMIEEEIGRLAGQNSDVAKELQRSMKVGISNILSEIERGTDASIAETGQQMVAFGSVLFPKWEGQTTNQSWSEC